MLTERDFNTNDWVGCGGLHMIPLIQKVIAGFYKPRTLDMGCGCGAIGITLLHQQLIGELVMTDIDPQSVAFAMENVKRLLPQPTWPQVSCYLADVWEKDGAPLVEAPFDLIVCNAPLSADNDEHVPAAWNPYRVLSDGNNFQRRLFAGLDKYLARGGIVIIKDLVTNTWHTEFSTVRLISTLVGDGRTLQQSTEFFNLTNEPPLPAQHCLRVFRRAK